MTEQEARAVRRAAGPIETVRANRAWWEREADAYQARHGAFLRDDGFVWCPEGLDEADARLLGEVAGRRVLEIGCGAGQCGRWLRARGGQPVGVDLAAAQLWHSRRIDARLGMPRLPVAVADAQRLPFGDDVFDLACSAYGAVPFVADSAAVMREVARVLRPGGRFVFSVTHPLRWCFLDEADERGLVACHPYFDRTPYVEELPDGTAWYAEHHRTIGDRVKEISAAGLNLVDLVEPEWPAGHEQAWDAWSPLRGAIIPGTAIFVCVNTAGG